MKAAGLMLVAVILGLLATQGSYALWNTAAGAGMGTVTAADFRVTLTSATSGTVTDMTLPNGTAASLSLSTTPAGTLVPGRPVYAGVQLGNVTNAGGDFTLRAAVASRPTTTDGGSGLAGYLTVKSVAAASVSQCSDSSLYSSVLPTDLPSTTIAKGAAGVFCFQASLDAATPASLSGTTAGISIPLSVTQI
jgi:hypothetical protein